jgi:copper homeostasis protein
MQKVKLEICVDTLASVQVAAAGGADRVELCAALSEGGLTPSAGFIKSALLSDIEVHVMIRPRGGDFAYSDDDLEIMRADIEAARSLGAHGVVFGITDADGALNVNAMRDLRAAAGDMECTLHRAIDLAPDAIAAVNQAIEIGMTRILTSGGEQKAINGVDLIAQMVRAAAGNIQIMPGSGVTADNAVEILATTGATSIHASCASWFRSETGQVEAMGFTPKEGIKQSNLELVKQLHAAINSKALEASHASA